MRYQLLASLLLSSVASATVITSTRCTASSGGESVSTSGETECTFSGGQAKPPIPAMASASSTADVHLPASVSDSLNISVSQGVLDEVFSVGPGPTFASATSNAEAKVDLHLTSGGSPRTGILQVVAPNPWGTGTRNVDVAGNITVTLNSVGPAGIVIVSGNCFASSTFCTGIFATGGGRTQFNIGSPFMLDVTSRLSAFAAGSHTAFGGSTTLRFQLFESDGVTPVSIQVVPEPRTWIMGLLGVAMLLGLRHRLGQF